MNKDYDVFDVRTGRFIEPEGDEYDNVYEQFLHDLDIYEAEQDVVDRIMKQHLRINNCWNVCMD